MYLLVLLRHGESTWNKENRFTGWTDVDLSENGIVEAYDSGRILKDSGFIFDPANGDSFTLNEVGSIIFNCIREGLTGDEIFNKLSAEFELEKVAFDRYFLDFTIALKQYNLLENGD